VTVAKPLHHILDVYGAHLHAAVDLKGWNKIRKTVTTLDDPDGALGFTSCDVHLSPDGVPTPHLSVYVDVQAHGGNALALVDTCAHEASHVATFLFNHIGEPIRVPGEAHAYLTGWVTAWLIGGIGLPPTKQAGPR
jgi:hypothetical protein